MPTPESPAAISLFGPPAPLQGLTLLAVEDSRFACEALRLMAQRSGARLRRAATLRDARRHMALYRPDVALVDIGMPDGSGASLIRELVMAGPGGPSVVGMSGDPDGRGLALSAGAAEYLDKPIGGIKAFQAAILRLVPGRNPVPATNAADLPEPDRLALQEDLARAARVLSDNPDARARAYVARFLTGLARSTRDSALARAAARLPEADDQDLALVSGLLAHRMGEQPPPFP